ncbi:MAG: hypothetical protein ACQEV6_05410 [Pseudomonadota bacterium]
MYQGTRTVYKKGRLSLNRLVYERFGSRQGFVRFLAYWCLAQIGVYRHFTPARPDPGRRLVFVCSGNICRSPLAEAFARSLGRQAASCGLNCGDGYPADPRACEFAQSRGLALNDHKTINVNDFNFRDDDFIVVMEPSHIESFRTKAGDQYPIALAGNYCKNQNPYIHDPYNCCDEFFVHCEERVMEAVRGICG